jgi:membrane-associated phospholipid phosphatase
MGSRRLVVALVTLIFTVPLYAENKHSGAPVEPTAGQWRTWTISSGKDYRAPAPPSPSETREELRTLAELISHNTEATAAQIAYWDAGAPAYRWMDLISNRLLAGTPTSAFPHRVYTYVSMAMYDATIATWESKYFYNRPRPTDMDHKLPTAVDVPDSPSYPSEHAAAAHAAAEVLAYFLPNEAQGFRDMADQAGWSRVLAGVQFPSDVDAGAQLGKRVAEQVIARAKGDGADATWSGTIPTGPCNWKGSSPPANITAPGFKPLLMMSADQFRSPAPPDCTSQAVKDETAVVRNTPRGPSAFATNYKAFYWQSPEGLNTWGYRYMDKWMAEDRLDKNPPRAARAYALVSAVQFDAFIASHESKYSYWYIRPSQLDPTIVPVFPVPNHPSYPSNHATFSTARAEILAYLFPTRAAAARALAKESGDSRISAGIHYPMDIAAGANLGKKVAELFVAWAESDRSQ